MDVVSQLNQHVKLESLLDSIPSVVHLGDSFFPIVIISFLLFTLFLIFLCLVKILARVLRQNHVKSTLFEVTPPHDSEQSAYTTEQLFTLFHGLAKQQRWFDRVIRFHTSYAFEIVSTKQEGIRYMIRVPIRDAELIKKGLLSYSPGVTVSEVNDYLNTYLQAEESRVTEFVVSNHFAYPLKRQNSLKEHDPIAYITGTMTKLSENETVAVQIVVTPVNKKGVKDITRITHLMHTNGDLYEGLKGLKGGFKLGRLGILLIQLIMLPLGTCIFLITNGKEGPFLTIERVNTKKLQNPYQQELEQVVKEKLDQPLFSTSLRLLVVGKSTHGAERTRGFLSSLSSLSSAYQSFHSSWVSRLTIFQPLLKFVFTNRLPFIFSSSLLSISEVSDIYHFPYTKVTRTEDIQKIHSKILPAPVSLKKSAHLDVVFAKNTYGGTETQIGLTQEERRRHMYIVGATGTGKSTMLLSMIEQDMRNRKGICVIDPHGELIDSILPLIPKERIKDIVYFNPDDISYPMGINLLELTKDLEPEEAVREKEFIAESIISVFHKIYTEKYSGPRMEYILRNTIHTAFTVPEATLFTIYKLLINSSYRKSVTKNLTDENLKDFWKYEFAKAGDYQKVKMISPITNKIGRFLFSPTAKRILEQGTSTINFDSIMNEGKILLCNLSKGKIGEDNSEVFGVLIMAKIQLAALKRARMKPEERTDFYLYVDEFQNFATPAFAQILSEARKYRLNAILAHQTTSQIEDHSLVQVTLANTGTVICFRTANPEDERVILPQFRPYITEGEIASLPSFHFYMRLGALTPQEPFSGETIPVTVAYNQKLVDSIIASSRALYTKPYTEIIDTNEVKSEKKSPKKVYSIVP